MLKYEVVVEDLIVKGHPHSELFLDMSQASGRYDELSKEHPHRNVVFFVMERRVIKQSEGFPPAPIQCPKGHKGKIDGKSVLSQGWNGTWHCGICGENWRVEV